MRVFTYEAATANALERADKRVTAISWDDPLAFGRLIGGNDLDAFASARSFAYAAAFWDEDNVVEDDLKRRNASLVEAFESGDDVYLLFGGSLSEQLSLCQILGWLSERPIREQAHARLMVVDGPLSVFEDGALLEIARIGEALPAATHAIYAVAWDAVTGDDPSAVEAALDRAESAGLSSLAAAMERWLRELPSLENGLSITQAQALDVVRLGIATPQKVFESVQETEANPFRNNWEFWQVLDQLCWGDDPLLRVAERDAFLCPPKHLAWEAFHAQRLELTERGRAVLEGRGNFLSGPFPERWLGGVKIDVESGVFLDYASGRVVRNKPTAI